MPDGRILPRVFAAEGIYGVFLGQAGKISLA